jgi:DNA-binding phage protein
LNWVIWVILSPSVMELWNSGLIMAQVTGFTSLRSDQSLYCSSAAVIKAPNSKTSFKQSDTVLIFKRDKMLTHKSYHSSLIEALKDPEEAAAYLEVVLEDGDLKHILLALKNVAEARRGLADAQQATARSENCYQELTSGRVPELPAIASLLSEVGLKLSVTVKDQAA